MLTDDVKSKPMHLHAGLLRRLPWLEGICCAVKVLLTGLRFWLGASVQCVQGFGFEPQHCKNTKLNQTLQAPLKAVNKKLTHLELSDAWCCPEEVNRLISQGEKDAPLKYCDFNDCLCPTLILKIHTNKNGKNLITILSFIFLLEAVYLCIFGNHVNDI